MNLTPEERRLRIQKMEESDPEYQKMKAQYDRALAWFEKYAKYLPRKLRNRLWEPYGMFYLMHHRTLTLICQQLQFQDEE